jgi:hypothetical protein
MSRRPLSSARLAANRRSAKKSTGPRTPAGKARARMNAFRHGSYVSHDTAALHQIGEDAEQYTRLLQEALVSCPPANPLEGMLVEDIARLRWERRRLQRAKEGKLLARLEAQEREWRRRAVETERDAAIAPIHAAMAVGLRRVQDSRAKFRDLLNLLEVLEHQVEQRDFSLDATLLFRRLWGVTPTARGAQIIACYKQLAGHGGAKHAPHGQTAADAEGDDDGEAASPAPHAGPLTPEEQNAAEDEATTYRVLKTALAEEKREVLEEYQLFRSESSPASRAALDACLAPAADGEWRLLLRWESAIDQQIERKLKLYMRLHESRPGRRLQRAPLAPAPKARYIR